MHSEVEKLVERLRNYRPPVADGYGYPVSEVPREHHPICDEAASLIERLYRERESLREGLRHLPSIAENFMLRFSVHDLPEDKAQQWQSLEHEIEHARRLLGTHAP